MTQTDIALLLADAADEVEIGIAPVQAVIRGGRRRRARRWAVAGATALVLAGSTGATVALTGLHGGGDGGTVTPATRSPAPDGRQVELPQRTELAKGTDRGTRWRVVVDVWEAPRNEAEARVQLDAMHTFKEAPADVRRAADLVGKESYFVKRGLDDDFGQVVLQNTRPATDAALSGRDIQTEAIPLRPADPQRLVIGQVAVTARQVTCTWQNGTTSVVRVLSEEYEPGDMVIRPLPGSSDNWFVCLAPKGTAYKSVEVTE
ncbi:hypothetical protein [Streptomyces brasiliensis]|nr:hypothetical protein [Streptomyces brasiliensis]